MRTILLIITILFSVSCFGQEAADTLQHKGTKMTGTKRIIDTTKTPKVDSMDMKVFSMRDLGGYLDRINLTMQSQLKISEMKKYEQLVKIIQAVYAEADKKRKQKN